MKVAVISDLHLGRGDKVDMFGHDDYEFSKFLRYLERNFEKVVLLGDVYETLTTPLFGSWRSELEAIKEAHPEVVKRFEKPQYQYIHGNHDIITRKMGAPDHQWLEIGGNRILFTHGHWYDWIITKARQVTEFFSWIGGWVVRLGFKKVFEFFYKLDDWYRNRKGSPGKSLFQEWALSVANERQADIIVTGHTHRGKVVESGDKLFLNSGSCAKGQYQFLAMDTVAGSYTIEQSW